MSEGAGLEFATECMGCLKPGSNRRYLVCIHCRKAGFSNKLKFNQHRDNDGCDVALYPNVLKVLLLPYLDF